MFKGGYPALYNEETNPAKWYVNYISTYVERDVRLLKNITDLVAFERFLRLCAGRIGQLLNMSSLAEGNTRIPIEIKSGQTVTSDYMKGILFWNKMTQTEGGFVVYGGDMMQNRSSGIRIVPYKEMNTIASDDV